MEYDKIKNLFMQKLFSKGELKSIYDEIFFYKRRPYHIIYNAQEQTFQCKEIENEKKNFIKK